MPETPRQPPTASSQVLEEAAEWFALLRSGVATDAELARWRAWLAVSPRHQAVWQQVERISGRLAPIAASPQRELVARSYGDAQAGLARQRRRFLLGVAGAAGSGLLGWTAWRHTELPGIALAWLAGHRSATGEIREVGLSDGTRVWLASASAFGEDYRHGLRRLELLAGEILVRTAPDADARGFVVDTPQGRLRALGTRFAVRLEEGRTFVAVYEGAVQVQPGDGGGTAVLRAGEQTRFTSRQAEPPAPADPAREAWTRGILVTQRTPLADVVAELRRYRHGHIGVAPEVADLPVFGSYPIADPDRALAMLETVMPIRVRRSLPWWIRIEPADKPSR